MKIFVSVGEPSGDLHGANLARELRERRPDIELVGFGGPRMTAAGCQVLEDLTRLAVMWFWRVLINLHHFFRLLRTADRYFRDHRPDAVVVIDYPGFNFLIARAAKRHGIPVYYYGAPQMWAWAPWRVRKMRRRVDHVLCKLPFEEAWYRKRGCAATYVGHPYFDELHEQILDKAFLAEQTQRPGPLVTILPGSRTQEVELNLPWFLEAATHIHREHPTARFAIAAFNEQQAEMVREQLRDVTLPVEVHVGRTTELIHAATCCMACSGSVSLELLYHEKPTVILYRVHWWQYAGQTVLRRVKYITLVNLLASRDPFPPDLSTFDPDRPDAERVPFPEYLALRNVSDRMAAHISRWLRDPAERAARIEQLRTLKVRYAHPGATRTAADFLLTRLSGPAVAQSPPQAA
jgi:lipid-A-disaccharide synthase